MVTVRELHALLLDGAQRVRLEKVFDHAAAALTRGVETHQVNHVNMATEREKRERESERVIKRLGCILVCTSKLHHQFMMSLIR